MSFGGFERGQSPTQPMAEINVTPLVDVMLVLLVIFILTAPFLASSIPLQLPRAAVSLPAPQAGQALMLELDRSGQAVLNGEKLADEALVQRLTAVAVSRSEAELQLRADRSVPYGRVVQVLALAHQAGIVRVGFVTEPPSPARRP
jgi:biopolymer transport protein TolR